MTGGPRRTACSVFAIGLALVCSGSILNAEPPVGCKWKLVWSDEFDGKELDTSKWEKLGDWKRKGGYWVREDAYLDSKGHLVLRTKKDGERYTSGAVRTKGRFEHTFGYYEIRCKLPVQPAHWAAFWLFSPGVSKVGNGGRDGTEIDIFEAFWRHKDEIQHTLHWDYGKHVKSANKRVPVPGLYKGFHTFALHWKPDEYVFYVNGKETWRTNAGGVSQVPSYIKVSEETARWAGDITKAKLPDYFTVDYVRVYDEVPE